MNGLIRNASTCLLFVFISPCLWADESKPTPPDSPPSPLSVAPLDHIEYPKDRPAWVSQSTDFAEDAHVIVVVSGPSETPEESLEELRLMQRAAVATYVSRFASGAYDFYPISDEQIDRELVARRYAGEVTQGDMSKYEHAVELVFTEEKRQQIQAAWRNVEVRARLGVLGLLVLGGLVTLISSSAMVAVVGRRIERRDGVDPPAP
jgi:hypothetical protein